MCLKHKYYQYKLLLYFSLFLKKYRKKMGTLLIIRGIILKTT